MPTLLLIREHSIPEVLSQMWVFEELKFHIYNSLNTDLHVYIYMRHSLSHVLYLSGYCFEKANHIVMSCTGQSIFEN